MTNPKTIDRRDVSHATNPIGRHDHIEATEDTGLARPLDSGAATLPAGRLDQSGADGRKTAHVQSPRPTN